MTRGCTAVKGPYMCELDEGHSGDHRVRYKDSADRTWTDEETDYYERD